MDKSMQLTPGAVQEMVLKDIESTMSSFSGRIMKAVDNKLSKARMPNPTADTSNAKGGKTDYIISTPHSGDNGILSNTCISLPTREVLTDAVLWSGVQTMAFLVPIMAL